MIYLYTPRITNSRSELKKILKKEAQKVRLKKRKKEREKKNHSLDKNY